MSTIITEAELLKLLRHEVNQSTQIAFAYKHNLDRSLLNRILTGNKPITIAVARALGYEPAKAFKELGSDANEPGNEEDKLSP